MKAKAREAFAKLKKDEPDDSNIAALLKYAPRTKKSGQPETPPLEFEQFAPISPTAWKAAHLPNKSYVARNYVLENKPAKFAKLVKEFKLDLNEGETPISETELLHFFRYDAPSTPAEIKEGTWNRLPLNSKAVLINNAHTPLLLKDIIRWHEHKYPPLSANDSKIKIVPDMIFTLKDTTKPNTSSDRPTPASPPVPTNIPATPPTYNFTSSATTAVPVPNTTTSSSIYTPSTPGRDTVNYDVENDDDVSTPPQPSSPATSQPFFITEIENLLDQNSNDTDDVDADYISNFLAPFDEKSTLRFNNTGELQGDDDISYSDDNPFSLDE